MFQRFVDFLQRLWARLSWTGGVHYLNGGPGLPPPLTPEEEKALLARMADGDPAARDELMHTMACKAAIKGGWTSDPAELKVLVEKVQSGEVRYCPHGRPVVIELTRKDLEKQFRRA